MYRNVQNPDIISWKGAGLIQGNYSVCVCLIFFIHCFNRIHCCDFWITFQLYWVTF